MALTSPDESRDVGTGVRRARWWHLVTFIVAAFGVGFQIWLEAAHPISPDRPPFTTATRIWNVLSFFTIWSNILVAVIALLLTLDPRRRGAIFGVFRAAVVEEANAIGTACLRAQTLAEPDRTSSLTRLVRYTDTSIRVSHSVPNSPAERQAVADGQQLQRELWALAGHALDAAPTASAPRLYVESLNNMIDMQTVRVSGLANRVPGPVLALEVIGAAVALGLLAFYLAVLGRGVLTVLLAAALVTLLLLVTIDLDRPTRGLIRVPAVPLTDLRASVLPPAATGPTNP
jgi:hypothetical protein